MLETITPQTSELRSKFTASNQRLVDLVCSARTQCAAACRNPACTPWRASRVASPPLHGDLVAAPATKAFLGLGIEGLLAEDLGHLRADLLAHEFSHLGMFVGFDELLAFHV